MKVNKIKNQKHKLFKYNLLKLQLYSKPPIANPNGFSNNVLEPIEAHLKQALKIIYEYHVYQHKILFVGFPVISKIKQIKLIHFTNHHFISKNSWINGIIRNRFSILTYIRLIQSQNLSKKLNLLLTIKAKPHLVVIFNQKIETNIINEFYKAGIPVLFFDWTSLNAFKVTYKILGNFNFSEKNTKFTFFSLLYSLLKKAPRKRSKNYR